MKEEVFEKILTFARKMNASDIHFKKDSQPMLRINGALLAVKNIATTSSQDVEQIAKNLIGESKLKHVFEGSIRDLDFAIEYKNLGRYRINIFRGFSDIRVVIRLINEVVPSIEDLYLPKIIEEIASHPRGLVLVTGTAGSGKSTTLASIIEHINKHYTRHVITIEDPIEYLIKDKKSLITQREIGTDCHSISEALRSSMRQDPDVILVGEMRDFETINAALMAAETGHLVLSTLHTQDATESIGRILSFYPVHMQKEVRFQLAAVLKATISQRLIQRVDGSGRIPAVEIMINNARISELIIDPQRTREINDVISESHSSFGMQTFDQSFLQLVQEGYISEEKALELCSDPNRFVLKLKGITSDKDKWNEFDNGEDDYSDISLTNANIKMEDE